MVTKDPKEASGRWPLELHGRIRFKLLYYVLNWVLGLVTTPGPSTAPDALALSRGSWTGVGTPHV